MKGAPQYGKGSGKYVCKATAMHAGGTMGSMTNMGGSMGHGSMGGGAMATPQTMSPQPPASMGTPRPMSSGGNVGAPSSGNQGNTGAPGAGGQVPNNPAATPNATPHP
jgi:hypothetical protein